MGDVASSSSLAMSGGREPLLIVEDLRVAFRTEDGVVQAVDGVSFHVDAGEVLAIVGESGCGKSVTGMTLLGLTRGPNARFAGRALFGGKDLGWIERKKSVLDRVREDASAFNARLGQEDKTRLDEYLEAVRDPDLSVIVFRRLGWSAGDYQAWSPDEP